MADSIVYAHYSHNFFRFQVFVCEKSDEFSFRLRLLILLRFTFPGVNFLQQLLPAILLSFQSESWAYKIASNSCFKKFTSGIFSAVQKGCFLFGDKNAKVLRCRRNAPTKFPEKTNFSCSEYRNIWYVSQSMSQWTIFQENRGILRHSMNVICGCTFLSNIFSTQFQHLFPFSLMVWHNFWTKRFYDLYSCYAGESRKNQCFRSSFFYFETETISEDGKQVNSLIYPENSSIFFRNVDLFKQKKVKSPFHNCEHPYQILLNQNIDANIEIPKLMEFKTVTVEFRNWQWFGCGSATYWKIS